MNLIQVQDPFPKELRLANECILYSASSTITKDDEAISAAFMASAHSNLSTFATKYGRAPGSETRKELAAKGRGLKEWLASEAGANLSMPEE